MGKSWQPPVNKKQMEVLQSCHPYRGKPQYQLISGPRLCGKSTACFHALVNHAWNVQKASISLIALSVTMGDDGGCWTELTQNVIPKWIEAGFGMEWVTKPRQKGTTKKLYCQISNKFGGISTFQLDSLLHEHEVEQRFKSKQHSAIYVSEASYFRTRKFFDTIKLCLRGERWTPDEFLLLLDTNPAEEGTDSWLWQLFYDERIRAEVDEDAKLLQKQLRLIEFTIDDNTYLPEVKKAELRAGYAHSEDLMARYYYGKWVRALGNSIFHEVFRPLIHIVGEFETASNPNPEILLPEENCFELLSGWDIGGANSAFHLLEKVMRMMKDGRIQSFFKVLDEVVYIGSDASMTEFVDECLEKVDFWESFIGRPVHWRNWSDRSAFDIRERISNVYHHQLVAQLSNNRIILQAADRSPGSVRQRVDIAKKLLFEQRILVSKSRCSHLIDSFQGLRAGKGHAAVDKLSKYKHAFDSFSYAVASESYDELSRPRDNPNSGTAEGGSFTSVPL